MDETEGAALFLRQVAPIGARRLQQPESAHDVRLDEGFGSVDGAVDVRLGCEVDDCPRLVCGQQAAHKILVGDIAFNEDVPLVILQGPQIFAVTGIGQLVQIDDGLAARSQPVQYKVGAYKASPSSNQNH